MYEMALGEVSSCPTLGYSGARRAQRTASAKTVAAAAAILSPRDCSWLACNVASWAVVGPDRQVVSA
jgi:hypothetical protein